MEQNRVLWNDAEVLSQTVQSDVANVFIPQQNPALVGIVESVEQPHNCGFTEKKKRKSDYIHVCHMYMYMYFLFHHTDRNGDEKY